MLQVAELHIAVHAWFRAILFCIVGCVLHSLNSQDQRTSCSCAVQHLLLVLLAIGIYCSLGYVYTAVFLVKKVLIDVFWLAWSSGYHNAILGLAL